MVEQQRRPSGDPTSIRSASAGLLALVTNAAQVLVVVLTGLLIGLRLGGRLSFGTIVGAYVASAILLIVAGLFVYLRRRNVENEADVEIDIRIDRNEVRIYKKRASVDRTESEGSMPTAAHVGPALQMVGSPDRPLIFHFASGLFGGFGSVMLAVALATIPSTLIFSAYILPFVVAATLPLPLQTLSLVTPCFIVFGVAVVLAEEERRRKVVTLLSSLLGRAWTLSAIVAVFFALTSYFALFASVLAEHGMVSFVNGARRRPDIDGLMNILLWNFSDEVPFLKVTQTLRWDPPFDYVDTGFGSVILLYKVSVILPILAVLRIYWRSRRAEPEAK